MNALNHWPCGRRSGDCFFFLFWKNLPLLLLRMTSLSPTTWLFLSSSSQDASLALPLSFDRIYIVTRITRNPNSMNLRH